MTLDVGEEGRVDSIACPDGSADLFRRDAMGNVTNFIDALGRTNILAWLPGRNLQSVSRTVAGANLALLSNEYDKQFNSLIVRDALGRIVETYELDEQDRPYTIQNVESQEMTVVCGVGDYIRQITRFDGTVVSNAYGEDGLVSSISYPGDTNTFTYLKNGLLWTASSGEGTISNAYAVNRLVLSSSSAPSGTVEYTYYPAGQVSNTVSIAGTNRYELDEGDRLHAIVSPAGTFEYAFSTNDGKLSAMEYTNTGIGVAYGTTSWAA